MININISLIKFQRGINKKIIYIIVRKKDIISLSFQITL